MIFDHAFLRTRVARRILGLFLICCLLPIAVIGVLGYIARAGNGFRPT